MLLRDHGPCLSSPCPHSLLHSAGGFGHFPGGVSPTVIPERLRPHIAHLPQARCCPVVPAAQGHPLRAIWVHTLLPLTSQLLASHCRAGRLPWRTAASPLVCSSPDVARGPRRQPQLAAGRCGWEQDRTNVPPGFVCPARWGLCWRNAGPLKTCPQGITLSSVTLFGKKVCSCHQGS